MITPLTPGPGRASLPVEPVPAVRDEQTGPPRRSKVLTFLAALACAGCCAIPLLVPLGVLTGAGIATATTGLLVVSGVLFLVASLLWFLHHRTTRRRVTGHACAGGNCSC